MNSGKILQRFFKHTKYTTEEWDQLIEDFKSGESKRIICAKYKLKFSYYKAIKKYVMGDDNE